MAVDEGNFGLDRIADATVGDVGDIVAEFGPMRKLIRSLLGVRRVIGSAEATDIARRYAAARGWPWLERVRVWEGVFRYLIVTNGPNRGVNVRVEVRVSDGSVAHATFVPR